MSPGPNGFAVNGRMRARDGFLSTWRAADGRLLTVHRAGGSARIALRLLIDELLDLDSSFRLVAYSTPQTIFRDLTGMRAGMTARKKPRLAGGSGPDEYAMRPGLPERQALAAVGRLDLLALVLGGRA